MVTRIPRMAHDSTLVWAALAPWHFALLLVGTPLIPVNYGFMIKIVQCQGGKNFGTLTPWHKERGVSNKKLDRKDFGVVLSVEGVASKKPWEKANNVQLPQKTWRALVLASQLQIRPWVNRTTIDKCQVYSCQGGLPLSFPDIPW